MDSDEVAPDASQSADVDDPRRYRMHLRPHPRILESLLPVAVYIACNSFASTQIAIASSFAASVVVFARNRGYGTIRFLGLLGFAVLTISANLGLIADSGKVYVAQNLVSDFIFAGVFAGSVLAGRPLIGGGRAGAEAGDGARAPALRAADGSQRRDQPPRRSRADLPHSWAVRWHLRHRQPRVVPTAQHRLLRALLCAGREAILIWPADMPAPNRDGTPRVASAALRTQ